MVFCSAIFLFLFLPAVFLLDRILPSLKARNVLLVAASLLFYAFGEPVYVLLMLLSIFMNYIWGRLAAGSRKRARAGVVLAVITNIGLLAGFKYTAFLIENLNFIFNVHLYIPEIRLPVGISFFTFQALSYVIDVYRDPSCCQKHLGKLMLYIAFFPQLVAGPIVRYQDIAAEIDQRRTTDQDTAEGIRRFIGGLAKKLLIANTVGWGVDQIFAVNGGNIIAAWTGAVFYCLQIYYDFSGYSDMAIGLGRVFGFHFKENFNDPYTAASVQDFWRRWHMSLTGWFRNYLYIPLGGNRKGRARTIINQYIVFFMTGLWHGASWNFVLWGLLHGTFLVLENSILKPLKNHKISGRVYTLLAVTLTFVLFRADSLSSGFSYLNCMFTGFHFADASWNQFLTILSPWMICIGFTGILLALPVRRWAKRALSKHQGICNAASLALFALCVLNLSAATFNPFIYFRF